MEEQNQCGQQHPSTVYYMELLNENPDWDETMSLVAEDLLNKFDNIQDGWVVLVGDRKTYEHYRRRLAYFEKLSAYFDENLLCCRSKGDSKIFRLS